MSHGRTCMLSLLPALPRRRVLVLLILGTLGMAPTINAAPPSRVACGTCEESDRFVQLQQTPLPTGQNNPSGFTHPFHSTAEEWRSLLQTISIRTLETSWSPLSVSRTAAYPAFTSDEIDYLSATLPRAFTEARPDEWVTFGLSRVRTPGLPELIELTTGAWFVQDGLVHLILANHHEAVTMPGIRDLLRDDPLHRLGGSHVEFVVGTGQQASSQHDGLGALRTAPLPELMLAYPTRTIDEPLPPDQPSTEESPPSSPPAHSLEGRLRLLERLKDQGLISEEEYRTRRLTLLNRL